MQEQKITNHWTGQCFGCSSSNPHGLQLHFWRTETGCFTRCIIPTYMCGIDGIVHGGILATLMDEVAGWALIERLGEFGMTTEMNIRYAKPVPTNLELLVMGQILDQEKRKAVVHSAIYPNEREISEQTLLAEATSHWVIPKPKTLARYSGTDARRIEEFLQHYPPDANPTPPQPSPTSGRE